jgi:hypothetical protein
VSTRKASTPTSLIQYPYESRSAVRTVALSEFEVVEVRDLVVHLLVGSK